MNIASVPHTLWHLYLDNLVYYKPGSWVDSVASTCRVLAFMTILPFILLTLLDVASYVIARTLGVIDETKASTSGELETSEHLHANKPAIVIHDDDSSASSPPDDTRAAYEKREGDGHALHMTPPSSYFRNPTEEEGNLQLSGVGTFSPAPSQPGSPTLQRREIMQHAHYDSETHAEEYAGSGEEGEGEGLGSGAATPRDTSGHGSAGSSSGESSFAMLDRDSGSEDAGVLLRRRTRRPGTATGPGAGDVHVDDDGAA
ncbi:hypothetical protein ONZ51_g8991 [Trametes cubensis]|uniref:Uncharacterized protein n=1 Tax=Trametes cubensis TaxID=1111947 RepID=A0AAD7X846_9APHY|nr:hypothetical protein ONZ51_g8991 [Trametes cubensis]